MEKEVQNFENQGTEEADDLSCFPKDTDDSSEDELFQDTSLPTKSNFDETIINDKNYYKIVQELNEEQKKIFWFMHDWCQKKRFKDVEPLHVGIIGGAGTGKSRVIHAIDELFKRELPSAGKKNENVCVKLSFTGMAAQNIDGRTFHSFFGLGHGNVSQKTELQEVSKATARERMKDVEVIIEDEISLETSQLDDFANIFLNSVFGLPTHEKNHTLYNNMSIIKVGDFMQLNSAGTPLYKNCATPEQPYARLNENRWQKYFKCFELTKSMRQQNDDDFVKILNTVRYMTVNAKTDLSSINANERQALVFLQSRDIRENHKDYPHNALHLFPKRDQVDAFNHARIQALPDTEEILALESKSDETGTLEVGDLNKMSSVKDDKGLPAVLVVGVGARVMVTRNEDVEDKIVNGLIGTVTSLSKNMNGLITSIWIQPDDPKAGNMKWKSLKRELRKKHPKSIPITKKEDFIPVAKNSTKKRRQFPLKLAYAATVHKYQGQSLDEIVISGFDCNFWPGGMFYTAFSRCRTREGIFLPGFRPTCIKANLSGLREIERIRKESMLLVAHKRLDFFDEYPSPNWFLISYQNVRSVISHVEDILADPIMMASDIICLTETSIDNQPWPLEEQFSIFDIFTKSRRESYDDEMRCQRKSGGVAVLVKNEYQSTVETTMKIRNIELLSTVISSTHGELIIVVLYKDHIGGDKSMKAELIEIMHKVFQNIAGKPGM